MTISDVLYGDTNATFSTNQNDPDLGYLDSDTSTWVTRATGDFNLDFRGVQEKRATPTKIIVEISNPDAMNLLGQSINTYLLQLVIIQLMILLIIWS